MHSSTRAKLMLEDKIQINIVCIKIRILVVVVVVVLTWTHRYNAVRGHSDRTGSSNYQYYHTDFIKKIKTLKNVSC